MPRDGDLVELHFHGTLDDGAVFDTSRGRKPRFFVLGRGQLLPAFEAALRPMAAGETRTFRIEASDAYGPIDPASIYRVPKVEAPEDARVGDMLQLTDGRAATVVAVEDETVTVDANHPLAGHTLNFTVELISSRPAAG
ncbi:MAG: FKBP-type peptidyl-prolyl cis-trans isomerase [Dehalococcoidia bacterium]